MKSTRNGIQIGRSGNKRNAASYFFSCVANYAGTADADCSTIYGHWYGSVLGTSATAAVGATSTVNLLIGSTVSAISIGFLAYISQSIGAGKKEQAKKASGQAVLTVVIVGIFLQF